MFIKRRIGYLSASWYRDIHAIDLSFSSPSIYTDFSWSVHDDQCGSDHFPIILTTDRENEDTQQRWKFKKADWASFRALCSMEITQDVIECDSPVDTFTNTLLEIADKTIPKTSTSSKVKKPWYDDECRNARKQRLKSEKFYRRFPISRNHSTLRIARAKARRTVKSKRKEYWRNFVSKLNNRTPISKVWNMINKIRGKGSNVKSSTFEI